MKTFGKTMLATLILITLVGFATASPADVTIFPEQSSSEINSFTSYEVQVQNVGPTSDVYYISSNSNKVTLAPTTVPETGVLEPGESRRVNVWYNPTEDMEAGTYSFDVTATSRATDEEYTTTAQVDVIKDHQVSINVEESQTVCLGEQATYEVEVTNDGIQSEEFQLTTRYGELSETEVALQPGETRTVTLTASADEEVTENFNVIASSKTSYAQDIQNVEFNTETCYDSETSISPESQEVPAYGEAEYDVTVSNTGTQLDSFVVSSNTGELEQTEFEIEGGETQSTTLTVSPTELGEQTVDVTAISTVESEASATMNVYNGMDANVAFTADRYDVCEEQEFSLPATIENTGEAEETFELSSEAGNLTEDEVTLEPGENTTVNVTDDSERLEEGTHGYDITAEASTFGEPVTTAETEVNVENCWDLQMNVVPKVASAGENRSVVYEIQLNNTGTQENTYMLSYEGPDWISIQPDEITVESGAEEKAYMYAGIPFEKEGEVEITAMAQGTDIERSETVRLLIGEELEDAIRDDTDETPTGGFTDRLPELSTGGTLTKIIASVLIGLLITAAVLYREW